MRGSRGCVLTASFPHLWAGYVEYDFRILNSEIIHSVKNLRAGGFLTVDETGCLCLTDTGQTIAEKIYERHQFFMEQLIAAGVDQETAEQDAHQIEHAISDISFQKLKEKTQKTN